VKCSNVINKNKEKKVCDGKVEFKQCAKIGLLKLWWIVKNVSLDIFYRVKK